MHAEISKNPSAEQVNGAKVVVVVVVVVDVVVVALQGALSTETQVDKEGSKTPFGGHI